MGHLDIRDISFVEFERKPGEYGREGDIELGLS